MVLLLSLAILAGLSLLALLAANSMLQQQHMAANHSDGELARLAAMTAVTAGEKFVLSLPNESRINDCRYDCFIEPVRQRMQYPDYELSQPEFLPDEWWLRWGQGIAPELDESPISGNPESAWTLASRQPPLFIIRELEFLEVPDPQDETSSPSVAGVAYYQVLGRGTGLGSSNTHVAESIIARPWLADTLETSAESVDCHRFRPGYDCGRMAFRERR